MFLRKNKARKLDRVRELKNHGVHIEDPVHIGRDCFIDTDYGPLLTLEKNVVLAYQTCILLHDSALNNVLGLDIKAKPVVIKENSYIGARATILPGVTIGPNAIIGAGSVVTQDIPANSVAAGNPARVLSQIDDLALRHRTQKEQDPQYYLSAIPWKDRSATLQQEHAQDLKKFLEKFRK